MMKSVNITLRAAIAATMVAVVGTQVSAQTPLTLSQALERGLKNNYGVLIGQKQVESAGVNNSWGAAGAYPTFGIGGSANFSRTMPGGADRPDFNTLSLQPNADVSWTLFGGFRMWRTKAKLDAAEELAGGNHTVLLENSVTTIISAYYMAVLEAEKVTIAQRLMEVSQDRYKREQRAAEIGVIKNLDLLQAQNAWLQDRANFLSQKVNRDNAVRQLNYVMAEERQMDWLFADSIPMITENPDQKVLRQMVISNNRTMKNQYVSAKIRAEETLIAQADYYPTVTVNTGANFGYNHAAGEGSRQLQPYVGAKLSANIFNGNKRQRAMRIARINEEVEQLNIQDMQLSLGYELDKLYDAFVLRKELVGLYTEQLRASELSLRIAEQKYAGGTMTQFDFRDVQIAYYNAAVNLLTAKYNLVMSHSDMLRITGAILDEV